MKRKRRHIAIREKHQFQRIKNIRQWFCCCCWCFCFHFGVLLHFQCVVRSPGHFSHFMFHVVINAQRDSHSMKLQFIYFRCFFFIYVSFVSVAENEHSNLNNTLLANYCANDCFVFALAGWWTHAASVCACVCLHLADCVCGMIRGWNQNDDFCPQSRWFYWAIYFGRGIQRCRLTNTKIQFPARLDTLVNMDASSTDVIRKSLQLSFVQTSKLKLQQRQHNS